MKMMVATIMMKRKMKASGSSKYTEIRRYCSLFVSFFFFLFFFLCFLLFFVFIVVISHSVFVSEMKLFVRLKLCVFSNYNIMSSSPISYSLLMST